MVRYADIGMLEDFGEGQGFLAKVCKDTPLFGGDHGLGCLRGLLVMWFGTEPFPCVS
jgi:hypothetical protein